MTYQCRPARDVNLREVLPVVPGHVCGEEPRLLIVPGQQRQSKESAPVAVNHEDTTPDIQKPVRTTMIYA